MAPNPAAPISTPLGFPAPPKGAVGEDLTPRFVLQGVSFDGTTEVPPANLESAWTSYRGRSVSMADLRAIGRSAEGVYARAGYPFVAILLQVQKVSDGVVHYSVVEGKITDLTVLGLDPTARRQATTMLQPLVNRSPLSLAEVERAYLLARQIPGLGINGTLRRGDQPGGMDLVVNAVRPDLVRVYVNVNNLYANAVGPWGVLVGADYYGQSRYGDDLSAQIYTSIPFGRQVLARGSYAFGLDNSGTRVTISGLWGKANPQDTAAPLELATDVATVRTEISQPLIERHEGSLVADVALDISDQRTRVFKTAPLSFDKLRIFSASLLGETSGSFGRLSGSLEIHQGLDFAGASHAGDADLSRPNGDPQATVFKASLEAESATVGYVSLAARADMQLAGEPLTAPDQYAFGNLTIGRGYEPGAALGDSVVAGSVEVRVGPLHLGKVLQVQPFGFIDWGRLYNRGAAAQSLTSIGGGLRFQIPGKVQLDLVYAAPQDALVGQPRPSPELLLNLTVSVNDVFAAIHHRIAADTRK
ncbi:MAG: ShlB/FhaC/HecB family hemolysin secretion/activation protein [Caulobacterales bacterium]